MYQLVHSEMIVAKCDQSHTYLVNELPWYNHTALPDSTVSQSHDAESLYFVLWKWR